MPVTTQHFAIPFDLSNGSASVVEQDSPDDIANCVEAILRYTPGLRTSLPAFGISDQVFRRDVDVDEIRAQVAEYEPRAVSVVEDISGELQQAGDIDEATRLVRIELGA